MVALAVSTVVLTAPGVSTADDAGSPPDTITGSDGRVYPAAPRVVVGRHGELFYGRSFDLFCADGDGDFEHGFEQLARLATVIRSSGRRVVFSVVPDKAHVRGHNLVLERLPHGRCDRRGIRERRRLLAGHRDPSHLSLTGVLSDRQRRLFWKTDSHWTSVGTAAYARALATRLDPALGARQRYRAGRPQTALQPFAEAVGRTTPETVPTRRPAPGVRVHQLRGPSEIQYGVVTADLAWRSSPAKRTLPGRTLVLGDSFACLAIENLRPLFRRGRFLWVGYTDQDTIDAAVVRSDTVVIEIAEWLVTTSPLTQDAFRQSVRRALRS